MKWFFYLGVILIMISFLFGCSSFGYQSPHYVKLAEKITEKTALKLLEKKDLYLIGTGGSMMKDIQMMMMGFNYFQEVDIQTAREMLVYAVNDYLTEINNNTEVRTYLHEYPFTAKNIEIVIYFHKPDRSDVSPEKISIASSNQGEIDYYINDKEKNNIKSSYEETYEEAMKKISSK